MFKRFARIFSLLGGYALVQAALLTGTIAFLYRDVLFAPYRFFTIQIFDAFTKAYFWLASVLPLPDLLNRFVGQSVIDKLGLFPELASIGVFVALLLALVLVPFGGLLAVDDEESGRAGRRVLGVAVLLSLGVHVYLWVEGTKIPLDPNFKNVTANFARNAIYDGVLVAMGVCVVSALVTLAVSPGRGVGAAAAAVLAIALWTTPAGIAAPGESGAGAEAPAKDYNVILVSIDSLRADRMSLYGHNRPTSPSIDALASTGVAFNRARSTTSWTLPSHMSMLTGRSLLGHGVVSDDRSLDPSVPTLAESFSAAGYATGAVVSAPYVESRYGFGRGFDDYDDKTISFATNNASYKSVTAPLLNETAVKWIDGNKDGPFFLFLHYWDVHYDFMPGPPYDTMFDPDYEGDVDGVDFYFNPKVHIEMEERDLEHVLALYDGEIRLVDDHIGKLRKSLADMGIADRTILVVTSDHGEEFFEHGRKGHHRTLYEEVLRVPLVINVPGLEPATSRIDRDASIIDIAPTVLGLTGIDAPSGLEGVDFTPAITGSGEIPERATFAELYRKGSLIVEVAAMDGPNKVIHHFNHRQLDSFDLAADPGEQNLLAADAPSSRSMVASLRDWVEGRWKVFDRRIRTRGVSELQLDSSSEDALRALGYIE